MIYCPTSKAITLSLTIMGAVVDFFVLFIIPSLKTKVYIQNLIEFLLFLGILLGLNKGYEVHWLSFGGFILNVYPLIQFFFWSEQGF